MLTLDKFIINKDSHISLMSSNITFRYLYNKSTSMNDLTICIKMLPDFQETSCIQVIKSRVHVNKEK